MNKIVLLKFLRDLFIKFVCNICVKLVIKIFIGV